jgi:Uncharacterized conserved protein (DUF2190)
MATNRNYAQGNIVWPDATVTAQGASRTSNHALANDPVVCGQLPGIALDDADSSGSTRMQIDGIFTILVAGKDSSGTSGADASVTVLGGDKVYFDSTKTPPVSKRAGGVPFGIAVGDAGATLVASGNTTTEIMVQIGKV